MKDGLKLLGLFDPHIKTVPDGKGGWKPDTAPALETALQFGEYFKPDITVTGQDFMEFDAISFWQRNNRLELEGRRLAHDFEHANQILDRICNFTKEKVIFIPGNHDYWLQLYIQERPELYDLIDQRHLLRFKDRDIEGLKYGSVYKFGKAAFAHAFLRPRQKGNQAKYHAAKMADEFGSSIFYGHWHSFQAHTKITYDTKPNVAMGIGCLSELNPSWLRESPNAFVNQLLFLYYDKQGHFTSYAPILIDGKFFYGGKVFGNKEK